MSAKCRNCNTCIYFPCDYYHNFNIDKEVGCIYWSDEIVDNFISNNLNGYAAENIQERIKQSEKEYFKGRRQMYINWIEDYIKNIED